MVKAIPEGYHSFTPYLVVNIAGAAIHFYKYAFEPREIFYSSGLYPLTK